MIVAHIHAYPSQDRTEVADIMAHPSVCFKNRGMYEAQSSKDPEGLRRVQTID